MIKGEGRDRREKGKRPFLMLLWALRNLTHWVLGIKSEERVE